MVSYHNNLLIKTPMRRKELQHNVIYPTSFTFQHINVCILYNRNIYFTEILLQLNTTYTFLLELLLQYYYN